MKFFIDTADVNEIREAESLGILDGVTTNPTLISKTGRPFKETIEEICSIVKGPVSAEVVSVDTDGIIKEGRELVKIADNIVVKVPLIKDGLKAVKAFNFRRNKGECDTCASHQIRPCLQQRPGVLISARLSAGWMIKDILEWRLVDEITNYL